MLLDILTAAVSLPVEIASNAVDTVRTIYEHLVFVKPEIHPQVSYGYAALIAEAVIAAIPAIMKMIEGDKQGDEAKKILKNNQRPVKTVPKELSDNLALANYRANSKSLPGANAIANRLGSNFSKGVDSLVDTQNDPASIAAGIAALDQGYNKNIEELGIAGANFQNQSEQTLMGARTAVASSKDMAWDWNERSKYLSAMSAASALQNASGQNKYGATQDLSTLGVSLVGGLTSESQQQQQPSVNMNNDPTWNAASTTAPYNYSSQNAFPTAQQGAPNLTTTQQAQNNVNNSYENQERKQRLISIYGSEANIPDEYKIFFQ